MPTPPLPALLRALAVASVLCLTAPLAAQRAPVPDAPQQIGARSEVLRTVIDRLILDQGEFPADVRAAQLMDLAIAADDPAARFVLFDEALRVGRERGSLAQHRAVLDAFVAAFDVDPAHMLMRELGGRRERDDACIRSLVVNPIHTLRERIEDGAAWDPAVATQVLGWAMESLDGRLQAWADRELTGILRAREEWQRVDATDPVALRAFREACGPLDLEPGPEADDKRGLVGAADGLRARARDEQQPWIRNNLQRRAWRAYARAWSAAEGLERARIEAQLTSLEDGLAEHQPLGHVTFADPSDLSEFVFARGQWQVHGDALHGQAGEAGVASTATLRQAFRTIDSVCIRGGIASADGTNFRAAIGPCNLLLNWEVARESHVYVGGTKQALPRHVLEKGTSHDIRVRQLGDRVAVFVDGALLATAHGTLAGTVAIYPALHSAIFVDELTVVGDPDPTAPAVSGPSHECR